MVADRFHPSVTVSVTVNVAPDRYVCVGLVAVLVAVPSPKFHRYVIRSPLGSTVPALLSTHARAVQATEMAGTGGTFPAGSTKLTPCETVAELPHPSVAVSVTVYEPGVAYTWVGAEPVLGKVPSPQFHEYVITSPTFGSIVPDELAAHDSAVHEVKNVGVGATLPAGTEIGTDSVVVLVAPHMSLAVSVAVNVLAVVYV
jgi:hypothetical protein